MLKFIKNLFILPITWLLLIILSILLYLLSYLPRAFSGRYYHSLARFWCRMFVRALDVDLRLIHKNIHPLPAQYILIANHPSALEDFAIPALFDIYPLAKAGVRDWVVLGRISDYAGTVYVTRSNANSRQAAKQALSEAVKSGKNIVIFPEGGCKGARIYQRFHTGAFDISLHTGVPILPVFLQYIDQQAFVWKDQTLVKKLWQIFRSDNNRVNYYVFDAIKPDGFKDRESFAEHAHSLYLQWQKEYLDSL
ncbi:MAG: 1-acyl-sn-glycerol-3-phosphate acyltransferase [Gammaproteobacteria bacterium]|nr:1-acyl-sn-glycerol-3-phosphate acyltransferase [Gammaproteobacteria bacterium]MBT8134241.1 1-acyl-sn-glycerol-3-phosphate acyltransferase [Gammaproteobacteria bacterium]NNJ49776.1 1-acyl-sn-glycerol-3-phosphate acyltransferase [Gammaproteobacteria bacterium]